MTIIASVGEKGELGRKGQLCWHIREDLKRFKELTMGGAVIMGRHTWESLPRRPLPGRLNIVITSRPEALQDIGPDALAVGSLPEAVAAAEGREVFIIGGGSVYAEAMPLATRLELTRIHAVDPEADTFFPPVGDGWRLVEESERHTSAGGLKYTYQRFEISR